MAVTKKKSRAKGRPTGASGPVGPEALIAATRDLLRRRRPQEITRKDIARLAAVDPGLIRYYFGDKNNLLLAATMQIEREHRQRERDAVQAAKTAPQKLKAKIRVLIDMVTKHPNYSQLILEQIHGRQSTAARKARHEMVGTSFRELTAILDEGVRRGELRAVEPQFLHVAMIGMCQLFFNRQPLIEELFKGAVEPRKLAEAYAEFVQMLILRGIETDRGAKARR